MPSGRLRDRRGDGVADTGAAHRPVVERTQSTALLVLIHAGSVVRHAEQQRAVERPDRQRDVLRAGAQGRAQQVPQRLAQQESVGLDRRHRVILAMQRDGPLGRLRRGEAQRLIGDAERIDGAQVAAA
ncbi:MAG: hypothetical protein AAGD14_03940 [Planctomycetota bacterium]